VECLTQPASAALFMRGDDMPAITNQLSHRWKWVASGIDELIATQVYGQLRSPLFKAAFTRLMIDLNEIAQAMSKTITPGRMTTPVVAQQVVEVVDITDLINIFRVALCHLNSNRKRWPQLGEGEIFGGWMVQTGGNAGMIIGGYPQPVTPPGDCLVGIGPFKMLLVADLQPALDAALAWARLDRPRE